MAADLEFANPELGELLLRAVRKHIRLLSKQIALFDCVRANKGTENVKRDLHVRRTAVDREFECDGFIDSHRNSEKLSRLYESYFIDVCRCLNSGTVGRLICRAVGSKVGSAFRSRAFEAVDNLLWSRYRW